MSLENITRRIRAGLIAAARAAVAPLPGIQCYHALTEEQAWRMAKQRGVKSVAVVLNAGDPTISDKTGSMALNERYPQTMRYRLAFLAFLPGTGSDHREIEPAIEDADALLMYFLAPTEDGGLRGANVGDIVIGDVFFRLENWTAIPAPGETEDEPKGWVALRFSGYLTEVSQ